MLKCVLYITFFFNLIPCVGNRGTIYHRCLFQKDITFKPNQNKNTPTSKNKPLLFLWREDRYNKEYKTTFSEICINKSYCKRITEPERAIIGYIATFIGSECDWDGECNSDRSNLKCKLLSALKLGYQCSDTHLGFLKKWFKEDYKALKRLEDCSTTPYTATIQNTFEKMELTHKNNNFYVTVYASGINSRENRSWYWKEINHFILINKNQVKLLSNKTIYLKKK